MPDETFDYIVIGSGSAGGVVAARLTEDPDVRVLLLEAGPADDDDNIHIPLAFSALFKTRWDWNYETTPQKHLGGRRAYWPRMKALGGCSSMNAMIYIRGNHADYDEWRDAYGAALVRRGRLHPPGRRAPQPGRPHRGLRDPHRAGGQPRRRCRLHPPRRAP